jgi:hypothetical protein
MHKNLAAVPAKTTIHKDDLGRIFVVARRDLSPTELGQYTRWMQVQEDRTNPIGFGSGWVKRHGGAE